MNNPSSAIRAAAPTRKIHRPNRTLAPITHAEPHTKRAAATHFQKPGSGKKNSSKVTTATMQSVPPIHTGLEIQ
ncbi:Uncharacterised protein [Mycobacteroides abscessus subsp. abscessus]|nr:Uncharacterised protein [Mycobacteroides abscessus subsp. abscessus]